LGALAAWGGRGSDAGRKLGWRGVEWRRKRARTRERGACAGETSGGCNFFWKKKKKECAGGSNSDRKWGTLVVGIARAGSHRTGGLASHGQNDEATCDCHTKNCLLFSLFSCERLWLVLIYRFCYVSRHNVYIFKYIENNNVYISKYIENNVLDKPYFGTEEYIYPSTRVMNWQPLLGPSSNHFRPD
jgi:hypothetical protein